VRVVSSFWVGAYVRRCHGEGAYATVARKGATEAGAIFVVVDRLDGTCDLYAPAPQALVETDAAVDRRFEKVLSGVPGTEVKDRIAREVRFDSDLWVVEIEDRQGRSFLDLAEGS
jgi:hypothetical protein